MDDKLEKALQDLIRGLDLVIQAGELGVTSGGCGCCGSPWIAFGNTVLLDDYNIKELKDLRDQLLRGRVSEKVAKALQAFASEKGS